MSNKVLGSCLCQKIKIEIVGEPLKFSYCHCRMCQKFSGGPFGAFIRYNREDVKYIEGYEYRKVISSSEWAKRAFCSECGTSLEYIYNETNEYVALSAGVLDDDPMIRPHIHIFVKDKCPWYEINDDLEKLDRY